MDLGGEKLDLEPLELLPAKKGDCSEAAAEVWLLSRPHAHAADSGGSRLSPAVTPAIQPCQGLHKKHWLWGSARPEFKSQFLNFVAYSFRQVTSFSEP